MYLPFCKVLFNLYKSRYFYFNPYTRDRFENDLRFTWNRCRQKPVNFNPGGFLSTLTCVFIYHYHIHSVKVLCTLNVAILNGQAEI